MSPPKTLRQNWPELWRTFVRFWPYLRQHRGLLGGSLLMLFAGVGLRLLEPWPLKIVFDHVIRVKSVDDLPSVQFLDRIGATNLLFLAALGVIAIALLRAMADYAYTVGFAVISNRVLCKVREDVYRHLQGLSLSFHTKAKSGDLIIRVIGDVNQLKDATVSAALPLLANLLILSGMVGLMCWLQWQLALLVLVMIPLYWLSTVRIGRRLRDVSREQRRQEGTMAATAVEALSAIKIVQALSLESKFAAIFSSENTKSLKESVKATQLTARLERTVDALIAVSTALVLWYGARLVLSEKLSPGDLIVFLAYLKTAFRPVRDLAKYTARLARASASGERVLDILDRTSEVHDLPDAVPAPVFRGSVQFQDVSFSYEPDRWVLQDIAFEVAPGQSIALVGPSGIGKSTLISMILRLYDPVQGSVKIDGRNVREYTLASLRSQISVVLQDSVLFGASVVENIAWGAPGATRDAIETAARLAHAHQFIQDMPQGYDTVLGERGVTLSHGQRQRIAIARAMVRKAPILILDEPTTGLDEENERAVVDALQRLSQGSTTFMITHDLRLAASCDLILYLEHGRVLERGTHAELMQFKSRYAHLYELQAAAHDHSARRSPDPEERGPIRSV